MGELLGNSQSNTKLDFGEMCCETVIQSERVLGDIGFDFMIAEPSGLLQTHIFGNGLMRKRQEFLLNTK
jgi:hypothetical protein